MVIADRRLAPTEQPDYKAFNSISNNVDVPSLVQVQVNSFQWLKTDGLKDLLQEISPIEDFSGGRFDLKFLSHEIRKPKNTERECRTREITYSAPLYVTVQLVIKETGELKEQTLFFGDLPMMTKNGTFVINGAERVVVSQLVRSPGAYFTTKTDPATGRELCSAKLIPYRGAWVELETSNKDLLSVKVDRKRKAPISTLLRALGWETDDEIRQLVSDVDDDPVHNYMEATLAKDTAASTVDEALLEFYRRLRPGEPPSVENASELINNLFFNERKYDLGRVGRYKLNRRLSIDEKTRTLTKNDIVELIRRMITINNGRASNDDIDHLGNRRVRSVGELLENQFRIGLLKMERAIKERMSSVEVDTIMPQDIIYAGPDLLRELKLGFRSEYIYQSAKMIESGEVNLEEIYSLSYDESLQTLVSLPGVGDKVANCVLLFAFNKLDAFPVDVWINRAITRNYLKGEKLSPLHVRNWSRNYFGNYAGYANQYLFHRRRLD